MRGMKRTGTRRARGGCSGLGAFLGLLLVIGAIVGWPMYLVSHGARASGVITEKLETVRIEYDQWFRSFEVVATYSIPGQPVQHRAGCDVDEKTYDSLHPGNPVVVYYFASLLQQPFLPATRLSPCSTMASISVNAASVRLVWVVISLLAILFIWRVLRIRIAAWLLLPWLCLSFAYLMLPRVEPEPQKPVSAVATVDSFRTITTIGGGANTTKSIDLSHPYQIVRLKFVPPGMDTPVIAIDKVDAGSVPNLKEGQSVNIIYDASYPRIARMQEGTRSFPGHARTTLILCGIAVAVVIGIAAVISGFFRLMRRTRMV
ncbi:MAG: hypothetical protein JO097_16440 [Acidobacteriaceae bacterium]|nr:hypothetical protein [Acidobacteriaceae bacterium]MBV9296754.1 hypothetical protein [Acidobacteriaceae bacterium]